MPRFLKNGGLALFLFVLVSSVTGQAPPITIDEIISKADAQRRVYVDEFRNLLSEETKTIETFDKKGRAKKSRLVKSIFIVYQLSKDEIFRGVRIPKSLF